MNFMFTMSGFPTRCSSGVVRLMGRLVRLAGTLISKVCFALLRTIIAGVVFSICAIVSMHYLGLPVPVPSEVIDNLESLGRLTKILS